MSHRLRSRLEIPTKISKHPPDHQSHTQMMVIHSTSGYGCDMRRISAPHHCNSSRPSYNLRCKSFLRFIGFLVSSLFWIIIMNSKLDRSCRERKLLQNPPISHIAKQWENTDRKWTDFSELKHFFKNRISTRDSHVLNATETPDYRSIKHL